VAERAGLGHGTKLSGYTAPDPLGNEYPFSRTGPQAAGPPAFVEGSYPASLATQFGCHHTSQGGKLYGWVR
jgi:hypothetical protein